MHEHFQSVSHGHRLYIRIIKRIPSTFLNIVLKGNMLKDLRRVFIPANSDLLQALKYLAMGVVLDKILGEFCVHLAYKE